MASSIMKFAGLARQTRVLAASIARRTCRNRTVQPACFISTSKKNKDSASAVEPIQTPVKEEEMLGSPDPDHEKNWISYGFDLIDKETDRWAHNITMFLFVSVGLCWTGFILAYMPDHHLKDWAQREAYLELARREKEGLPMIDCEYIDTSKVVLPSDEELGDTEIII